MLFSKFLTETLEVSQYKILGYYRGKTFPIGPMAPTKGQAINILKQVTKSQELVSWCIPRSAAANMSGIKARIVDIFMNKEDLEAAWALRIEVFDVDSNKSIDALFNILKSGRGDNLRWYFIVQFPSQT